MTVTAQQERSSRSTAGFSATLWLPWLLLAIWVALLRSPTFLLAQTDADESYFLLLGEAWNRGLWPYETLWDVKPPGLFALFAAAQLLVGPGLFAARLLTAVAVFAGSAALWRLARNHLQAPYPGNRPNTSHCATLPWAAAVIYPAYSLVLAGDKSRAELLLAPFVIFGFDIVLQWRRDAAVGSSTKVALPGMAGLVFGLAFTIKQTAVFEAGLSGFLIASAWPAVGVRRTGAVLAWFTAGFLLPVAGFLLFFAAHGMEPGLYLTPLLGALQRLGGEGPGAGEALSRVMIFGLPILPLLVGGGLLVAAERGRIRRFAHDPRAVPWIAGWAAASTVGVLAMRALFAHYELVLVAPFLLLTLVLLRKALTRGRTLVVATMLLALYPWGWVSLPFRPKRSLLAEAAESLVASGLRPGGSLYAVDLDPVIYRRTAALPPTRYAFPQHLLCDFALPGTSAEAEIAPSAGAPSGVRRSVP